MVQQTQLWWSLKFLHERFQDKGDTRAFYKWLQFFLHGVRETKCLSHANDDEWIHCRKAQQSDSELQETVARSVAILAFLGFCLRDSRTKAVIDLCKLWIPKICGRALWGSTAASDLHAENMITMTVQTNGHVTGLGAALVAKHATIAQVWKSEWQTMLQAGDLTGPLDDNDSVSLADLFRFVFTVQRQRRAAHRHIWPSSSASGIVLAAMQVAVVKFLGEMVDKYVFEIYMQENDTQQVVPASNRRRSRGSDDEAEAVAKRPKVSMSPDSIWEVVSTARESGLSGREALQFLQKLDRLCNAAGCHPNSMDAWMRRLQSIYDSRATIAFAGTSHINLIADASRHSNKEVLVTAAWSWENQTAAMCNCQVILPLDQLAPNEIDLTDLVETLAKELLTK